MAWIHDVAGSKDEAIKEMLLLSNQFWFILRWKHNQKC
jgi:hypothetical protein